MGRPSNGREIVDLEYVVTESGESKNEGFSWVFTHTAVEKSYYTIIYFVHETMQLSVAGYNVLEERE